GKNSELIPNLRAGSAFKNETRIAKVSDDTGECVLLKAPSEESRCSLLLNFFACDGLKGKVVKVTAKRRTGKDDLVGCMRKALEEEYGDKAVGVGGTFLMKKGTAKIHVMPQFSKTALKSEDDVNKWLNFFDMKGPMVFMSVFVSRDPGLEFRVEHTHGYGATEGGHYHFDITPDEVEYEGYFSIADLIYRLDRP
ncbi:UNVERIFIED_CONTAM: hypothetical protein GTU68_033486, partial [Idotea baltica]|nr:hypothetical protein [Idotea baltica]